MRLMKYLYLFPIVLFAFACSEDEEFVFEGTVSIEVQDSSLTIINQTNVIIYYFAVESRTSSVIDWRPCANPDECDEVAIDPNRSRVVPYMDIPGWESGTDVVVFLWYLVKDSTIDSGYREELLSTQTVATPSQ